MSKQLIAGVDEVGRGPLAGAVVACAVILPAEHRLDALADSKKISESKRERLMPLIKQQAIAWALGRAEVEEIDRLNILQASLLAMQRAVLSLSVTPTDVWVDGNHAPDCPYPVTTIIGGDALVPSISAASIIAKQTRDKEMILLDAQYPQYGFKQHKGYPTAAHREALMVYGPCSVHRKSFGPVKKALMATAEA